MKDAAKPPLSLPNKGRRIITWLVNGWMIFLAGLAIFIYWDVNRRLDAFCVAVGGKPSWFQCNTSPPVQPRPRARNRT